MTAFDLDLSKYELGWNDEVEYAFDPVKGLNQGVVEQISWWKGEPRWMTDFRLRSLSLFDRKPMAEWFAQNMPDIDFQDIFYYLKPAGEQVDEWDELPEEMMRTYEKLGIPEAERKYLAGVTAQGCGTAPSLGAINPVGAGEGSAPALADRHRSLGSRRSTTTYSTSRQRHGPPAMDRRPLAWRRRSAP